MAIVSIIGRPNVGKSSLFNKIIGHRMAIVDDLPGVTRDRLYSEVVHDERSFYLVDTGGIEEEKTSVPFAEGIRGQVLQALEESDVVLFVMDGREGATALERDISILLRRSGKPIIAVANKIDDPVHEEKIYDLYELGFEQVIPVSAEHKRNIESLLDLLVTMLPQQESPEKGDEIRLALVGRPNVGKSSILNSLAGSERSLVSDTPGTTRDAVDTTVKIGDQLFRIIDTAGLRRKSRIDSRIEYYSTVRTYQAIDRCHVALLVMEGNATATDQDKRLAGHVIEKGKGLVLAVNKWDLVSRDPAYGPKLVADIREEMAFVAHAPLVFISALSGRNLRKIPELIRQVHSNRSNRVPTARLNALLRDILAFERLPGDSQGRFLRIYFLSQVGVEPPTFVFFVNNPELVTKAFERFIVRQIRNLEGFEGVPIRIFWRKKRS